MSSTTDKISGKTNQAVGKMTDNKKLQAKGKAQETKGNIKDILQDARNCRRGIRLTGKINIAFAKATPLF